MVQMFNTLISTRQLADLLALDCDRVVLDCRFNLAAPQAGRQAYDEGHIPHAQYVDLANDMSGPRSTSEGVFCGRNPLPDRATLANKFRHWGVRATSQIVAYDAHDGVFAARLWWLARWLGHTHVAVLDGQFQAWLADEGAVCQKPCAQEAGDFRVGQPLVRWVDVHDVANTLSTREVQLLDARPEDRYAGLNESLDARSGHIPGAMNRPFKANLDARGRFKNAERLRSELSTTLTDPESTIVYCGSGGAACQSLLAMEVAGFRGAALYPGSWSEWSGDANRPIEP